MADVFVSAGEALVIDLIDAVAFFVGWGTGAGTTAKGDTTLFTEAAETRIAAVQTQPLADKINLNATLTSLSAQTITNAGAFDLIAVGDMLVKGDFTGIVLTIGDKIEFDISLEMT